MKKILVLLSFVTITNTVLGQLNKQQTLDYILSVYQEAYCTPELNRPMTISCHYQTLIIEFNGFTLTSSLKDSLQCFAATDPRTGAHFWNIGTYSVNSIAGIRTDDECRRLYKAILHLQQLVKSDKDPFDN
jgi:hypothetical protein